MNMHMNARLTPKGRERLMRMMLSGQPRKPPHEPEGFARGRCVGGSLVTQRKGAAGGRGNINAVELTQMPLDRRYSRRGHRSK